jgi:hypothetical protein
VTLEPGKGDEYSRALRDNRYRELIIAAYGGRHDAMDALWWNSNPLKTAPSGEEPPSAPLASLQRRVYSADPNLLNMAVHERELQNLIESLSLDREFIQAAIRAADAATGLDWHHGLEAPPAFEPQAREMSGDDERPPRARPSSRTIAIVIVALVGGVFLGSVLPTAQTGSSPGAVSSTSSPNPADALRIFDIAQDSNDLPAQLAASEFPQETIRRIFISDENSVYAARGRDNEVCLVVVTSAEGYVASCSLGSEFPPSGLRVGWSDTVAKVFTHDSTVLTAGPLPSMFVTWNEDGEVTMGPSVTQRR